MLVFIGRDDKLIKLRGYRIELDEIEQRASYYTGIKEVAAKVKKGTAKKTAAKTTTKKASKKTTAVKAPKAKANTKAKAASKTATRKRAVKTPLEEAAVNA